MVDLLKKKTISFAASILVLEAGNIFISLALIDRHKTITTKNNGNPTKLLCPLALVVKR